MILQAGAEMCQARVKLEVVVEVVLEVGIEIGVEVWVKVELTLPLAFNTPDMTLQYTQHGPLYIGYIFAFYATKMVSRDSGDTQVDPHRV